MNNMNNIDRTRLSNEMMNRIYVPEMASSDIISVHNKILNMGWWHLSEGQDFFMYMNTNTKYDTIGVTLINKHPPTYNVSVPIQDDLYYKDIIGDDNVYLYICDFFTHYTPYS